MPFKKVAQQREPQFSRAQEEPEAGSGQPVLQHPATAHGMEPGRPHQAFVESRLRQYLQDENIHILVKPVQDEIRAAALEILGRKLRKKPGRKLTPYQGMALRAVVDVVEHAAEECWTEKPFLSVPRAGTYYVDALVQLAHDAGWLGREIHIPEHPSIYYTRNAVTGRPVPRRDCFIRGSYLSDVFGPRLPENNRIYPDTNPQRGRIYYMLVDGYGTPSVQIYYRVVGGSDLENFSGINVHVKRLEVLRAANNKIAALKRSDLGWKEKVTRLYEIRKPLGLL